MQLLLSRRLSVKKAEVVVPQTPYGYEPVFALYHKNCLPQMKTMLEQNDVKILNLYTKVPVEYLHWRDMPSGWERTFINLNTPAELRQLEEKQ